MDAIVARKMWRTLEPYHGMIYFSPHAAAAYRGLGARGQDGYFASRSAAMGAVAADVVVATFFNFNPDLVRRALPASWDLAPPPVWSDVRLGAADVSLREALGDEAVGSVAMSEAAAIARRACDACTTAGRSLFAGHASLSWPDDDHLALWHAVTLLREFRGDGHVAVLVDEGIDGCEALITHSADGSVPASVLQSTRGWSDEQWADARRRLEDRGWLDAEGATETGARARQRIEARTDELAMAPWVAIGEDEADALRSLVRPFSRAIATSGIFAVGAG